MSLVLGCIADDLTGATDLAMILVRSGLKTVQIVGVPDEHTEIPDAEAVVVALKSRTIPAKDAVAQSLTSCDWLLAAGAEQIFFKYCSTFDSTSDGNIGPVTDALMARLDCTATIACPSFPENGRTVYRGHLFVNDVLLSESSLRNHPLTPMTDSNLQRVLAPQSQSAVANIYYETIEQGAEAIKQSLDAALDKTIFITDAMTDTHLLAIGKACDGLKLITGGSAVAQGLHVNFKMKTVGSFAEPQGFTAPQSKTAILSGSCSEATLLQLENAKKTMAYFELDATSIMAGDAVSEAALAWARQKFEQSDAPVLFYSSTDPETLAKIQATSNRTSVGDAVENTIGAIARGLEEMGVHQFIVAGGETSGAVIKALNVTAMEIGPPIDPGVPWTKSLTNKPLALALKSGNFGAEDFFTKAYAQIKELAANS
jgi:uncharacterized protein YgbK (DUF1537 family)